MGSDAAVITTIACNNARQTNRLARTGLSRGLGCKERVLTLYGEVLIPPGEGSIHADALISPQSS